MSQFLVAAGLGLLVGWFMIGADVELLFAAALVLVAAGSMIAWLR